MGAPEFGRLVDQRMQELDLSQARLAVLVGVLPDGRVLNETQVRRIREGERRLDEDLVARLVVALDLDPEPAWEASGLWPPGLTAEHLRRLRVVTTRPEVPVLATAAGATPRRRRSDRPVRAQGKRTTDQSSLWAGQRPALTIIAGEKDEDETRRKVA
jgi:transcriptional regulator with XRE-family HTH domain